MNKGELLTNSILKYREKIIYALIFMSIIIWHALNWEQTHDDVWYINILDQNNLVDFLKNFYLHWTSRFFVMSVYFLLLKMPLAVWILFNSLMFLLIIHFIYKFTKLKDSKISLIQLILLPIIIFLCNPIKLYNETGWMATTLNYIWPLATGFYVLNIAFKVYYQKKLRLSDYILAAIAILFSVNQEQSSVLLIGLLLLFLFGYYLKFKRMSWLISSGLVISIASTIFHLFWIGNARRLESEIISWYPEFKNFSIFEKLMLGIGSTSKFLFVNNFNLILFMMTIVIVLFYKRAQLIDKIIAITAFLSLLMMRLANSLPIIKEVYNSLLIWGDNISVISSETTSFLVICFYLLLIISTIVYTLLKYQKNIALKVLIIFSASFGVRVILGFSPTVYASGLRTMTFTNFLLILASGVVLKNIVDDRSRRVLSIEPIE